MRQLREARQDEDYARRRLVADQEERWRSELANQKLRVKELERQLEAEKSETVAQRIQVESLRVQMRQAPDDLNRFESLRMQTE